MKSSEDVVNVQIMKTNKEVVLNGFVWNNKYERMSNKEYTKSY